MGYSKSSKIWIFVLFLRSETFETQGKNIENIESKILVRISTNWNKSLFKFHLSYVIFIKEKIWICIDIRNLRITLPIELLKPPLHIPQAPTSDIGITKSPRLPSRFHLATHNELTRCAESRGNPMNPRARGDWKEQESRQIENED